MASKYPHGHAYDLFVSYSTRDLDWVRVFHDDLVTNINRFADLDVFPFLDKARLQPGYIWNEQRSEQETVLLACWVCADPYDLASDHLSLALSELVINRI